MGGIGEGREGRDIGDGGRKDWEKDTSRKGFKLIHILLVKTLKMQSHTR